MSYGNTTIVFAKHIRATLRDISRQFPIFKLITRKNDRKESEIFRIVVSRELFIIILLFVVIKRRVKQKLTMKIVWWLSHFHFLSGTAKQRNVMKETFTVCEKSWFNQICIMELIRFHNTQWNSIWLLGNGKKLCSEMNRYYIFESSPLRHFSRFNSEARDVDVFI